MSAIPLSALAQTGQWQDDFVAILPAIQTHAKIQFRHMHPSQREEAIAEAVATACVNYQRLATQGKLQQAYVSSLATFSVRHASQDRHVGGRKNTREVLSPVAQKKHGFNVYSLRRSRNDHYGLKPQIVEDKKFSPADTAAFRVDFGDWLREQSRRDRRIINKLGSGEGTAVVADRFGLSPARISQLRHRYERDWHVFQGEAA